MRKIYHIINSTVRGGAEDQLLKLITRSSNELDHRILLLSQCQPKNSFIGVKVIREPLKILKLLFITLSHNPSPPVLHSWLPLSELFVLLCMRLPSRTTNPVLVTSYHGPFGNQLSAYNLRQKLIIRLCYLLSRRYPTYIRIFVSNEQLVDYEFNVGSVNRDCVYIIPPYIPKPEYFQSRSAESENSRKKKNLIMLGMMARWDPLKCHAKLLRVLKHCNEQDIRDYNLILAGKGATQLNKDLLAQINELGLQDKVLLMGEIADKETFFSAIDMHILLSKDESFGLVTVEALLRSIPSIMTETGIAPELTDNINFRTCSHHDDARVIAAKVIELLDATITNYGKCKSNDEKIGYTPKSLTRFTEDNLKLYRQIYDKYKK